MKILPLADELFHAYSGTHEQTDMTMPIVAFRNFVDAPKNEFYQNCCLRYHLTSPARLNIFLLLLYAKYSLMHKSLRDFRLLRYSRRDGHAEAEHVNRGRDTPIFCPTLQVLDMSTLVDAADVNPVIKFLPHTFHVCGRNLITGHLSPHQGWTYRAPVR